MRPFFVLLACSIAVSAAQAADPAPAAVAATATAPKAGELSIKPALPSIKPERLSKVTSAARAAEEADAEAELTAKIAVRLAAMRANQQARIAAAAKARKAAEARKAQPAPIIVEPAIKPYHGNHWSYEGETGPAHWGRNPAWSKCGSGTRQSPIDLRDGMKVDLEQISFDYKPSSFNVIDNGHTIEVNVGPGNSISLQGRSYELTQFHFHRPSEERINGKGFEMVVHMEHKDVEGKLAVVSVLLERGRAQGMIQTVWNNLPLEKHDIVTPSIVLNPADVLPVRRDYFTYMGSLTKPPCSEGVLWLVMKEPMQASPAQMALFARLYPLNARPIQAHSGRVVKESN